SADDRGGVKVWDVSGERRGGANAPLFDLVGHTGRVYCVAYSPDGLRLASTSGGYDQANRPLPGEVKLWGTVTGQEAYTLRCSGTVFSAAFSPDSRRLVTTCEDEDPNQRLRIWDATPFSPELLVDREARSLVHFWFAKRLSRAEVLARIRADATIDDPVRRQA